MFRLTKNGRVLQEFRTLPSRLEIKEARLVVLAPVVGWEAAGYKFEGSQEPVDEKPLVVVDAKELTPSEKLERMLGFHGMSLEEFKEALK